MGMRVVRGKINAWSYYKIKYQSRVWQHCQRLILREESSLSIRRLRRVRQSGYLNTHSIVGVDTETRPSFKKGTTHKVALLQISTHDTCFLFRLNRLGLPDFLEEFLQNDVLKVGLSLKDDLQCFAREIQKIRAAETGWNCKIMFLVSV